MSTISAESVKNLREKTGAGMMECKKALTESAGDFRNLGVLLGSGVNLTATLRILVDIMAVTGSVATWKAAADRVRHGGKLSDALLASSNMPPMAIRMLRLGEETGQLPVLAGRVAEFYEAKLQRSLDRIVGIIGPLAIITISAVVGGLIVSVMTALLSVTQLVG